nr:peptidoglycan DD-metalloendopeptidase family protein [Shewanella intestini]
MSLKLSQRYKNGLIIWIIFVIAVILWSLFDNTDTQDTQDTQQAQSGRISVELDLSKLTSKKTDAPSHATQAEAVNTSATAAQPRDLQQPVYSRVIKPGDTLSGLFSRAKIDQQTMYKVLEADLQVLALDTLMPGNRIQFWQNEQGQLKKLELYFNAAKQVVFRRHDDGSFSVKNIIKEGVWQHRILSGEIRGSFYVSAKKAGLSSNEIHKIEALLKPRLNFAKELRAGDHFSVMMNDQLVDGTLTGNTDLLSIRIETRKREINAFQFSDGHYYDDEGSSLVPAFQRLPTTHRYRISSSFNAHRKHPITGRRSPHNGTDFAVPIGTPVLATGDGVVTLTRNHRYAGKYIVIQHNSKIRTRYLHLSKFKVHKGQHVKRGQVIALSGNTGRTTGPHLHYEYIVNGHPVNAMKVNITKAIILPKKHRKAFNAMVEKRKRMMALG